MSWAWRIDQDVRSGITDADRRVGHVGPLSAPVGYVKLLDAGAQAGEPLPELEDVTFPAGARVLNFEIRRYRGTNGSAAIRGRLMTNESDEDIFSSLDSAARSPITDFGLTIGRYFVHYPDHPELDYSA